MLTKTDVDDLQNTFPKNKGKTLFLHGGGLDSVAFLEILRHKNDLPDYIAHINYGQIAAQAEINAIVAQMSMWEEALYGMIRFLRIEDWTLKNLNSENGLLFGMGENPRLDGRNLILVLLGLQYADKIYIGISEEPLVAAFEDSDWVESTQEFLNKNFPGRLGQIEILIPRMTKGKLLQTAYKINNKLFDVSMTCWTPQNNLECGKCNHCIGKQKWKDGIAI